MSAGYAVTLCLTEAWLYGAAETRSAKALPPMLWGSSAISMIICENLIKLLFTSFDRYNSLQYCDKILTQVRKKVCLKDLS